MQHKGIKAIKVQIMNALVLTTLPHYLALLVSPTPWYFWVVCTSTTLSVLWHLADEPATSPLGQLDHILAAVWMLTDIYYLGKGDELSLALVPNGFIFLTNIVVTYLDRQKVVPYYVGHSVWHILSAIKSILVAYMIRSVLIKNIVFDNSI
jgi:hypothetical protein